MPAKVDAEDRRRRLVLAAAQLIADEGINALTNGKIAKRLSGSTTMVTHYFGSKRELVLDTYQTMASRSRVRLEQAMRESDDPLAACLRALLPLDDSTRLEWKVWLAYQGIAVGDPELMQIWASRAASAVDRVTRLIEIDISAGRMSSSIDPDMESGRLFALIQGMSFQSIVDPERWTPAHLRRIVDLELLRLRRIDIRLRAVPGAELADFIIQRSAPAARRSCHCWMLPADAPYASAHACGPPGQPVSRSTTTLIASAGAASSSELASMPAASDRPSAVRRSSRAVMFAALAV